MDNNLLWLGSERKTLEMAARNLRNYCSKHRSNCGTCMFHSDNVKGKCIITGDPYVWNIKELYNKRLTNHSG